MEMARKLSNWQDEGAKLDDSRGRPLIGLYYWPTLNGWKITIFLKEMGLHYNMIPMDITAGDQFYMIVWRLARTRAARSSTRKGLDRERISLRSCIGTV